ncbi:hypothetical protein LRE75_25430 [Streptomyces sp. 372A]
MTHLSTFPPPPLPTAPRPALRRARRAEAGALAALLADAFHDDPLTRWITPDPECRARVLPALFRVFLDMSFAYDAVTCTPGLEAVLLWTPPDAQAEPEARGEEFAGRFEDVLGVREAASLALVAELQASRHPARPHYYAAFGAVRGGARGRGLLGALVAEVLREADAAGCGAYAEASSAGGEASARGQGFVRLGEDIVLPDGGPRLRPMWREPR